MRWRGSWPKAEWSGTTEEFSYMERREWVLVGGGWVCPWFIDFPSCRWRFSDGLTFNSRFTRGKYVHVEAVGSLIPHAHPDRMKSRNNWFACTLVAGRTRNRLSFLFMKPDKRTKSFGRNFHEIRFGCYGNIRLDKACRKIIDLIISQESHWHWSAHFRPHSPPPADGNPTPCTCQFIKDMTGNRDKCPESATAFAPPLTTLETGGRFLFPLFSKSESQRDHVPLHEIRRPRVFHPTIQAHSSTTGLTRVALAI